VEERIKKNETKEKDLKPQIEKTKMKLKKKKRKKSKKEKK
jgi:hypothetical protein